MLGIVMWVASGIAVTGTVLNIYKKWQGFLFWCVSSAALFTYNVWRGEGAQAALWAIYFWLAVHGLIKWRRDAKT